MGGVFGVLLVLAVGCVVLDTARNRRPGASFVETVREVGHQPSDWQLVAAGLCFVGTAFGSRLTPWAALPGVAVAALVGAFLRSSGSPRSKVPLAAEVVPTPEPASNMRVLT